MKPEELEDMTTLTIKTNALDNNIRIIKRLANGAKVIAVLRERLWAWTYKICIVLTIKGY